MLNPFHVGNWSSSNPKSAEQQADIKPTPVSPKRQLWHPGVCQITRGDSSIYSKIPTEGCPSWRFRLTKSGYSKPHFSSRIGLLLILHTTNASMISSPISLLQVPPWPIPSYWLILGELRSLQYDVPVQSIVFRSAVVVAPLPDYSKYPRLTVNDRRYSACLCPILEVSEQWGYSEYFNEKPARRCRRLRARRRIRRGDSARSATRHRRSAKA